MVINIIDAGGSPEATDRLTLFTYHKDALVDYSNFTNNNFVTDDAETYDITNAELGTYISGDIGYVYVTGIRTLQVPELSNTTLLVLVGLALTLPRRNRHCSFQSPSSC